MNGKLLWNIILYSFVLIIILLPGCISPSYDYSKIKYEYSKKMISSKLSSRIIDDSLELFDKDFKSNNSTLNQICYWYDSISYTFILNIYFANYSKHQSNYEIFGIRFPDLRRLVLYNSYRRQVFVFDSIYVTYNYQMYETLNFLYITNYISFMQLYNYPPTSDFVSGIVLINKNNLYAPTQPKYFNELPISIRERENSIIIITELLEPQKDFCKGLLRKTIAHGIPIGHYVGLDKYKEYVYDSNLNITSIRELEDYEP